jgi:hypothetical protein
MRVGFPWISLDSLVRNETYQWVTWKSRRKNFLLAFPLVRASANGALQSWHTKAPDWSWGEFNPASDFLPEIVYGYRLKDPTRLRRGMGRGRRRAAICFHSEGRIPASRRRTAVGRLNVFTMVGLSRHICAAKLSTGLHGAGFRRLWRVVSPSRSFSTASQGRYLNFKGRRRPLFNSAGLAIHTCRAPGKATLCSAAGDRDFPLRPPRFPSLSPE